jgi:hypothetical protein
MGRATVVSHLGDGEYLITPDPDQTYLDEEIQRLTEQLATDSPRLEAAITSETTARAALDDAQAGIDTIIREAQAANNALLLALQAAMDDLDDATTAEQNQQTAINGMVADQTAQLAVYDQAIEDLKAQLAEATTPEQRAAIQLQIDETETAKTAYELNTNTAITAAYNDLMALKATTKAKLGVVNGAQQTWNDRDQKLAEIRTAMDGAEPLKVAWYKARDDRAALQLKLAAMAHDIKWLEAKRKTPADTSAWCADLTETLTGAVATVEIPGETVGVPVLIRPGYEGRAVWQAQEQHAALVDAVLAAQDGCLSAQSLADLARLNLDAAKQRRDGAAATLALLQADPDALPALIVSAQALLEAAETTVTTAEASVTTAEQRIVTTRATATAARAALQAARDAAVADGATPDPRMADGRMQPVASSSPWASFWNRAVLPAWQKWRPMYRLGEIAELAGDTCTVMLDAAFSSQQAIDINRETELTGVPIVYMECNGDAFEAGDRVVVEFAYHDQTKPRVVGFESHPRACQAGHGIFVTPASERSPIGFGYPFTANEGWGKPGVTAASLIKASELPAPSEMGGLGFQVLIAPSGSTSKYLYGEQRRELVLRDTTILGGAVAVTGPLDASCYDQSGRLKPSARFDVYSIANNYLGPLGTWHSNYRIRQFDKALQSEGIAAMDGDTSVMLTHPRRFGMNEASPIYKNGAAMDYTISDPNHVGAHSDGYTYAPVTARHAVGLAIRNVTAGSETVRRMVALFVAGRQQFEGTIFYHHYLLAWADPPYSSFTCSQLIDINYPNFPSNRTDDNQAFPYQTRIFFQSNESGTRMSAVAGGFPPDFDSAYIDHPGTQPVYLRVIHLDIAADGKSCAIVTEPRNVVPELASIVDPWDGSDGLPPPGYSGSSEIQTVPITYAIAYDRDTEKRLTVAFSETRTASRTGAGWNYTEAYEGSTLVTFQIGGAVVQGSVTYQTVTQYVGDGGTAPTTDTSEDVALLLGVDFVHDKIYFERLKADYHVVGEPGWHDYAYTATHTYQLCSSDAVIWSGSGSLVYPDLPPVTDLSKTLGLGLKAGYSYLWSMVLDGYSTTMPIRSGATDSGLYAGAYFPRSWYASDAYGNTLFVCYVPRVILPGDPESSGGINFSYRGFPNDWNGQMHMDQFPDGIQIARLIRNDGTVVELSEVFTVPGVNKGWKFAGVF